MADIEHLQYINSTPSTVFKAITTEKGLSAVWTNDLKVNKGLGAINTFGFGEEKPTVMKIIDWLPDKRLVWKCIDSDPEWTGTTISFDIADQDNKISLTLKHTQWRAVTDYYRFCNYNWAMFLYSLKKYCEDGKGMPYQKRDL